MIGKHLHRLHKHLKKHPHHGILGAGVLGVLIFMIYNLTSALVVAHVAEEQIDGSFWPTFGGMMATPIP